MHFPAEQIANLHRLAPEIVLCFFGILIMVVDPFLGPTRQRVLGWLGFIGTMAALGSVHVMAHDQGLAYSELIRADAFRHFLHVVVLVAAALAILGSIDYLNGEGLQRGEYYSLVLFATAGLGMLPGGDQLATS